MYEVPKSKKSLKQNQFEFKINGKAYRVPLMKYVKPSIAFALSETDDSNALAAVRVLFSEYLPEAFDEFDDMEQVEGFMAAWQEASGVTPGESLASADS